MQTQMMGWYEIPSDLSEVDSDRLDYRNSRPGEGYLWFRPSLPKYKYSKSGDNFFEMDMMPEVAIAKFTESPDQLEIFPTITSPSSRMLRPKYWNISKFTFQHLHQGVPSNLDEALASLEAIPDGFIKDATWGLGIQKGFKPIIDCISKLGDVFSIELTHDGTTGLIGSKFRLLYSDYDDLRRGMNRIQSSFQRESLTDRTILAHNEILTKLNPEKFPAKGRPYKPDTIFKIISGSSQSSLRLSKNDCDGIVRSLGVYADQIARNDPDALVRLQQKVELVNLDRLIEKYDEILSKPSSKEREWQDLFTNNPFVLSMVFSLPIVLISSQAQMGGINIHGQGAKIADFLVGNAITRNLGLVEIKHPGTPLVASGAYRVGQPKIASDLNNSVMQVMDQRQKLYANIYPLKVNTSAERLEAHSIECVVVVGTLPTNAEDQRIFDMYRHAFHGVKIVTFDELQARLVDLREFLTTGSTMYYSKEVEEDIEF